jgi:non-homologous end joining protein Ku
MTAARKTTSTTLEVGFLSAPVALHKVTTDGGKAAKWENRLVDSKGKPVSGGTSRGGATPFSLAVPGQGDPLGLTEDYNEAAVEALDEKEDAERAWSAADDSGVRRAPLDAPSEAEELTRQRGFETERGFVPAEDQLAAIDEYAALESARVVGFVRAEQVHRKRTIGAYYLVPADDTSGATARHLMEALMAGLQHTSRFAVVKWTKKKGQSLGVIAPDRSGGLVLLELAWGENVRTMPKTGILNGDIVTASEVNAMVDLIEAMAEPRASLDELRDDAVVLRQQLRALAEDGRVDEFVPPKTEEEQKEVDTLLGALTASTADAEDFVAAA